MPGWIGMPELVVLLDRTAPHLRPQAATRDGSLARTREARVQGFDQLVALLAIGVGTAAAYVEHARLIESAIRLSAPLEQRLGPTRMLVPTGVGR